MKINKWRLTSDLCEQVTALTSVRQTSESYRLSTFWTFEKALENLGHGDDVVMNPELCEACVDSMKDEDKKLRMQKMNKKMCPDIFDEHILVNVTIGKVQAWRCKRNKKNKNTCTPKKPEGK